jgi:serine/threonine-protein kinase
LNVGSQTSGCNGQYQSGLVSSQSPAPGASAQPNATVNLMISNCAQVPSVIGQSPGAAQATLSNAGFVAGTPTADTACANGAQPGQIDNQNPGANALAAPGSTVNLSVCQPATTTTTTAPSATTTTTSGPAAGLAPTGNTGNRNGGHHRTGL